MNTDFTCCYGQLRLSVDRLLNTQLEKLKVAERLLAACRYSLLSSGKRFRPVLVLSISDLLGLKQDSVLSLAAAVEYIHTASLIHDDLPGLDNDLLRRGVPTCHREFGEGAAVLAGDALFLAAFSVISEEEKIPPEVRIALVKLLSNAVVELCDGQMLDICAEQATSEDTLSNPEVLKKALLERHRKKTGALIRACTVGPAMFLSPDLCAKLTPALGDFGDALGLLFQVTDDILDVASTEELTGKDHKSDIKAGKLTFVSVLGVKGAREYASALVRQADSILGTFDGPADFLRELVHSLLDRDK